MTYDYLDLARTFDYDETSISGIRWKVSMMSGAHKHIINVRAGDVAGSIGSDGYWRVGFNNTNIRVSRIAWALCHEKLPTLCIDHLDGNILNNTISNLREVSSAMNVRNNKLSTNNKTGVVGVCKTDNKYLAYYRDMEMRNIKKSFSIRRYGEKAAFELACAFRLQGIAKMNQQGAGYTDRHGKDV